ncbi:alpha/beta hydrolase [Streptomyces sp. NPDC101166]|uniref:alpha/beta hydrolase n=1 Tax=Streptomyces sp. NPDC101166 TaxID=3366120 RepID=UPI003818C365
MSEQPLSLTAFRHEHGGERLSGVHGGGSPDAVATAVLLHGAGDSSADRLLPLLGEFAAQGCRSLAFDFSGHGESSGELRKSSLRQRFEQAVSVIDAFVPADGALVLVGFSMSGQTVADLVAHYGGRVAAVGLCAPAVYAGEAWEEPFGDGDGRFSAVIRTADSWRDSPALSVLRGFEGRAVLAVPGTDTVIPAAVTEAVQEALATRAQYTRLELPEAEHRLGLWFRDHPTDAKKFTTTLLTGLGERGERLEAYVAEASVRYGVAVTPGGPAAR